MNNTEIGVLVRKASRGDKEAFERLYEVKARQILYHTYKILGNHPDSEDAAQEVVVGMYRNIRNLKSPEAFNGWMQRIISNVCNTMIKNKYDKKLKDVDMNDYTDELYEENKEFLPHEYMENEELKARLKNIIDNLPEKRRRAIVMFYYDDMSYEEIAYALNSSVSAVSTNILKAKRDIRSKLDIQGYKGNSLAKSGAIPILTTVLNEDATSLIQDSMLDKFKESCAGLIKTARPVAQVKGASLLLKVSVSVILSTVIVCAGIIGINQSRINKNMESTQERQSLALSDKGKNEAWIKFEGNQCDCGHINPTIATFEDTNAEDKNLNWQIVGQDKDIKAEGQGSVTAEPFEYLKKQYGDGIYKISSEFIDKAGNNVKVERDFEIDTDGKIISIDD